MQEPTQRMSRILLAMSSETPGDSVDDLIEWIFGARCTFPKRNAPPQQQAANDHYDQNRCQRLVSPKHLDKCFDPSC